MGCWSVRQNCQQTHLHGPPECGPGSAGGQGAWREAVPGSAHPHSTCQRKTPPLTPCAAQSAFSLLRLLDLLASGVSSTTMWCPGVRRRRPSSTTTGATTTTCPCGTAPMRTCWCTSGSPSSVSSATRPAPRAASGQLDGACGFRRGLSVPADLTRMRLLCWRRHGTGAFCGGERRTRTQVSRGAFVVQVRFYKRSPTTTSLSSW